MEYIEDPYIVDTREVPKLESLSVIPETIYISIASYDDPYLIRTIKSIIDNADNPENIYFGVALQYEKIEIPDVSFIDPQKIIKIYCAAENRPGTVRIRHVLRKLMTFQEYFLQIDSHTHFCKGWDTKLKNDLEILNKNSKTGKVIISQQTNQYPGDALVYKDGIPFVWNARFTEKKSVLSDEERRWELLDNMNQVAKEYPLSDAKLIDNRYIRTGFVGGNFIFARKEYIEDTLFDSRSQFVSEEMIDSLYTYMSGWDVYANIVEHYLGHDNFDYNETVYNSKYPVKYFRGKFCGNDTIERQHADRFFCLDEKNRYSMPHATRSAEEYFNEFDMPDLFKKSKAWYEKRIIDNQSYPILDKNNYDFNWKELN